MAEHYNREEIRSRFNYDPLFEKEILKRAQCLVGLSIKEVIQCSPYTSQDSRCSNKGLIGNIIEEHGFGIKNNSSPLPDFVEAGIELKVIPLESSRKTGLTVKERTKVCAIDYFKLLEERWPQSHARCKLNKILFIYYHYNQKDNLSSKIINYDLWALTGIPEEGIIKGDWETVWNFVDRGEAHLLSESQNKILAASRAGQGGCDRNGEQNDLVPQPKNKQKPAFKRAFSLKQSFTRQRWLQIHKSVVYESIVASLKITEYVNFEEMLLKALRGYAGETLGAFAKKFNVPIPKGKNAAATIVKKAIGFRNVNSRIKEFEQLGIEVRIVPLATNNYPREAVSFPAFDIEELLREDWEDAALHEYVTKMLFIPVYARKAKLPIAQRIIGKAFFWSPDEQEWEKIEQEWERYRDEIVDGKARPTKKYIAGGKKYKEITNLSKQSATKIIHIRPHARKCSANRDNDPYGNEVARQSFWLNKKFVAEKVRSSLRDNGTI